MPKQIVPAKIEIASAKCAPELAVLSDRRRAFVYLYVMHGLNQTQAAIEAGYPVNSATVRGSEIIADPKVQAAIRAQSMLLVTSAAPIAFHTLVDICRNKSAKDADRIRAASEVLDRSGYRPAAETNINVRHMSAQEEDKRLLEVLNQLGESAEFKAKVLALPHVIDAEAATEVEAITVEPEKASTPDYSNEEW